jgi:hypothetical protein
VLGFAAAGLKILDPDSLFLAGSAGCGSDGLREKWRLENRGENTCDHGEIDEKFSRLSNPRA